MKYSYLYVSLESQTFLLLFSLYISGLYGRCYIFFFRNREGKIDLIKNFNVFHNSANSYSYVVALNIIIYVTHGRTK